MHSFIRRLIAFLLVCLVDRITVWGTMEEGSTVQFILYHCGRCDAASTSHIETICVLCTQIVFYCLLSFVHIYLLLQVL